MIEIGPNLTQVLIGVCFVFALFAIAWGRRRR